MLLSVFCFTLLLAFCWGQLTSESVSEPCVSNAEMQKYLATNLDKTWYSVNRNYYVPMANEYNYRIAAEALLGRQAMSQDELTSMKLRSSGKPPKAITRGFYPERRVFQTCADTNKQGTQMICKLLTKCDSPGTNSSGIKLDQRSIVLTDNKNFILYALCFNKKHRGFTVHSVQPTLQPNTEDMIKQRVEEMGFNPDYISYQTY